MYTKSAVKSYAQGKTVTKSYKRKYGEKSLADSLLGGEVMSRANEWRKGKRSKLAIILNPTKRRKRNSDKEPISPEVEDLSKEWHGREVKGHSEVEEIESYEEDLVDLGQLEELGIWAVNGELFTISFKKDRPTLACDGEGKNLEVVGGDQQLDLKGEGIEVKGKSLIPLGFVYSIVYETDKHHLEGSNGYPESYEHYFAEEFYKKKLNPDKYEDTAKWFADLMGMGMVDKARDEGRLPMAVYNKTDSKILLTGGNYEVTELGIKD